MLGALGVARREMSKPSARTTLSIFAGGVVLGVRSRLSRSAITATLTLPTPSSRSSAVLILAAQDAQSMPVTIHSCRLLWFMADPFVQMGQTGPADS